MGKQCTDNNVPHSSVSCLQDDVTTRRWLAQLLVNVGHLADAAALGTDVVGPTPPVQAAA